MSAQPGHVRCAAHSRRAGGVGSLRRPQAGPSPDARGRLGRRQSTQGGSHHPPRPVGRPAPDLVNRRFTADAPDRLWLADITYLPTGHGFLYLTIGLDAFSRPIVGWSMASNLRTELVLDALGMALSQLRPQRVVHHSDQGSQYTSLAFGRRCREAGVLPSMGKAGDCFDNAMARACSPASNANSSTARPSETADTPGGNSSATLRADTTPKSAALRHHSSLPYNAHDVRGRGWSSPPQTITKT